MTTSYTNINVFLILAATTLLPFAYSDSVACDRHRCIPQSKAAFFAKPQALDSGACGYGTLANGFMDGRLAAAAPSIYKNGVGCGACFKIKCKNERICSKQGSVVLVSDLNTDNRTDFVLSSRAFMGMAIKGKEQDVLKLGIADVEYKRIPCEYKKNLAIRVEESSQKPNYLAVAFLYLGGQTQIDVVDVAQVGSPNWNYMTRRDHGAVWNTSKVPTGALQFRFAITSGFDGKWYWAKTVLPAQWKNNVIYDTGIQITDIAEDGCSECNF